MKNVINVFNYIDIIKIFDFQSPKSTRMFVCLVTGEAKKTFDLLWLTYDDCFIV